jgi:hypothetical protein
MPAQCATISAAIPRLLSVVGMRALLNALRAIDGVMT